MKYRKNNTLRGKAFGRVRAKIEKNTLFERALVKIKAKLEKTLFLTRFCMVMVKI